MVIAVAPMMRIPGKQRRRTLLVILFTILTAACFITLFAAFFVITLIHPRIALIVIAVPPRVRTRGNRRIKSRQTRNKRGVSVIVAPPRKKHLRRIMIIPASAIAVHRRMRRLGSHTTPIYVIRGLIPGRRAASVIAVPRSGRRGSHRRPRIIIQGRPSSDVSAPQMMRRRRGRRRNSAASGIVVAATRLRHGRKQVWSHRGTGSRTTAAVAADTSRRCSITGAR